MDHKLIRIDSFERDQSLSESSSDFVLNYNNATALQGIKKVVMKNVEIPNVGYNINTTNNVFVFETLAPPFTYTITIPAGQYSIGDLIAAIEADASAIAVGLTITLNSLTGKLEFASTTAIQYEPPPSLGGNSPMARTLGLFTSLTNIPTGEVLSFNAEGFPDLSGNNILYISSQTLSDGSHLVDKLLQAVPVFGIVPITVPFGSIQTYETQHPELDDVEYPSFREGKNIQTIDIKVFDDRGRVVDLGGLDWRMILKVYY